MTNHLSFLIISFTVVYIEETISGNLFLFTVLLLIVIFLATTYFIAAYYKKKFAIINDTLIERLKLIKEHNATLTKEQKAFTKELSVAQSKFIEVENELKKCIEEKKKADQEITVLKDSIQNTNKNEDIIIEYYMNEKSSE